MSDKQQDWRLMPIKETYLDLFDGPHATPPIASDGPIFLGIGNFTDDGHLDLSNVRHIDEKDFPRWTKRVTPKEGDVVFTYEATLNCYAIVPNGFRGCLGRRLALIRPNPAVIDTRFLFYSFFSPEWRETIARNIISGATVERVPLHKFPNFPIRVPPLQVQRQIGDVLSTYDDFIDNNTRRIAILEEMARRIFEEWFVYFRAPGCERLPMVDSAVGPMPQGWEVKRLHEVARVNPEQLSPKNAPATISYIDIASVSPGSIDAITQTSFTEAPNRARRIVRHGDIIWSCVRPNRRSFALVLHPSADTIASTGFAVLRSIDIPWPYLYMMTTTQAFTDYLANHTTGSAYPAVKPEDFENARLLVSPPALFTRFCTASEPMLLLAHSLRRQNANLRAQRDLLLPKLISGEIDVGAASTSLK